MTDTPVRIEILTFEGCPNAGTTRERVRKAVEEARVSAEIIEVAVETPEAARAMRFLGSPSVRVDGRDVERAVAASDAYGLMCRTYREAGRVDGSPPLALLRDALRRRRNAPAAM